MLNELRNINLDRIDVDEAVALLALSHMVARGFKEHGMSVPEWIESTVATLDREVNARKREAMEKRRKELRALIETDLTAAERRAKHRRELDEIESKLKD